MHAGRGYALHLAAQPAIAIPARPACSRAAARERGDRLAVHHGIDRHDDAERTVVLLDRRRLRPVRARRHPAAYVGGHGRPPLGWPQAGAKIQGH